MNAQQNFHIVQDFFKAMGEGDRQRLLSLAHEELEWIIPGEGWPLAGTYNGHSGLRDLLRRAADEVDTSFPAPLEFVAQSNRVVVIGFAVGKVKTTGKTFRDEFVFVVAVENGKVRRIREYVDTQALSQASAGRGGDVA